MSALRKARIAQTALYLGRGQSPSYVNFETNTFAINQKCIRDGKVDPLFARAHDSKVAIKKEVLLQSGDVCINSTGTGTAGRIGLWLHRSGEVYFADSHVTVFRPKPEVFDSKYLATLLQTHRMQTELETFCFSGSTNQVELNRSAVLNLELRFLSLPEQQLVAKIFNLIDRAIEQTETIIAKQKRIKIGLMQDLLTKGVDEHGHIRYEATHEFKDSPLGKIPKEWEVNELRHHISYISYGFTNPMPEAGDGPYLVTAININDGKILYDTCRRTSIHAFNMLLTNKSRPKLNDLLITKDGSLGRLAIVDRVPLCINQSVAIMRTNEKVEAHFLKLLLESPRYQKTIADDAGGSTIKHIYITKIDKMFLGVPRSKDEQKQILKIIDKYNAVIEAEKIKLSVLKRTRQGLMQDLITGNVCVESLIAEQTTVVRVNM